MKTHWTHSFCAYTTLLMIVGFGFAADPVDPVSNAQRDPDVDNGIVVWAEEVDGNSSIYGKDLVNAPEVLIEVAAYSGSDQDKPAIWNDKVVFQENFEEDWDIYIADISDPANPSDYLITKTEEYYLNDQTSAAIHGNTVVWQSYVVVDDGQDGTIEDWDIVAGDITEPNNVLLYNVDNLEENQTAPAIYRSTVVYQDDAHVDTDVWSADIWLRNSIQYQEVIADDAGLNQNASAIWEDTVVYQQEAPGGDMNIYMRDLSVPDSEPVLIAGGADNEQAPDISGHIVVWQDSRHGNWDIYGYNLVTKKEFRITTNTSNQTQPAVSGSLVVWTDERVTPANIYYTWLDDETVADCPNPVPGDANGDCRMDLTDYAFAAQNWLICNLDPVSACSN